MEVRGGGGGWVRDRGPSPKEARCFGRSSSQASALGYAGPDVHLLPDNGRTWSISGSESLVQVDSNTVCFAFQVSSAVHDDKVVQTSMSCLHSVRLVLNGGMTSAPRGFLHRRCGSRQLRADQGIEAWGGVDSLVELSESMCQAASLLAHYDPFDDPRRPSTFLDAIVLGNVELDLNDVYLVLSQMLQESNISKLKLRVENLQFADCCKMRNGRAPGRLKLNVVHLDIHVVHLAGCDKQPTSLQGIRVQLLLRHGLLVPLLVFWYCSQNKVDYSDFLNLEKDDDGLPICDVD
ncbi:hypothetical protein PR202_gb25528 [Eleusine coracana subsp. coracana]|uniref:Xylanase inhibitor C-terminal domain-containing protein n=1 Tax=Eleusine coracana subsp. coracana TaxID=191504 RepID=A0AAV5FP74_ELECO|nr:hypothetical protein PR202_gb25528 [Eleusine coracana subsp. coracana]